VSVFAHQGLVLVLAVDIQQHAAKLFQLCQRAGVAVDEAAGAAVVADRAAQYALSAIVQFVFFQPGQGLRKVRDIEFRRYIRPFCAIAHGSGISPGSHGQPQSVQHNGLAGTGFPGQCGHAPVEIKLDVFGDRVIGNRKLAQHLCALRKSRYCDCVQ
jgi:hypothetical protein